jgi:hypothetical protein
VRKGKAAPAERYLVMFTVWRHSILRLGLVIARGKVIYTNDHPLQHSMWSGCLIGRLRQTTNTNKMWRCTVLKMRTCMGYRLQTRDIKRGEVLTYDFVHNKAHVIH